MSGRVCVLASFMADHVIEAPRRPRPGETVMGTAFTQLLGGKGFNQAVAARRAGAVVAVVGRLGNDAYGDEFRTALHDEGIDDQHVRVDHEAGTGIAVPLVEPSGQNSIVVVPRANHAVSAVDVDAAVATICRADALLLQLELPLDAVRTAALHAHRTGVPVVLNPAPATDPAGLDAVEGLVDVLIPNQTEAATLAELPPDGDPAAAAKALRERVGGGTVVVTLGEAGALLADDQGIVHLDPHPVPVEDTLGAGDAFCGALGAQLAGGHDLHAAVRFANAAGAIAVTRRGAAPAMPTAAEIEALLAG